MLPSRSYKADRLNLTGNAGGGRAPMTDTRPEGVFVSPPTSRTIIFANGLLADPAAARAAVGPADRLIAADGGLHHLLALGLSPHVLIGDLDSVEPAQAAAAQAGGARVERFSARKDQTDLELAVRLAVAESGAEGAGDILIFGALGARWDQTLANLLLLAHPDFRGARLRLVDGAQQIYLIQGQAVIEGQPGDTVSLISLQGDARGVTTQGLEYPLERGSLYFGSTLGVSNVLLGTQATVTVEEGLVACVVIGNSHPNDERSS
jgi:thiamine pyrophosphokinase